MFFVGCRKRDEGFDVPDIILWFDNCSVNKAYCFINGMAYLVETRDDVKSIRVNFFAAYHGNGPADRAFAVLRHNFRRSVALGVDHCGEIVAKTEGHYAIVVNPGQLRDLKAPLAKRYSEKYYVQKYHSFEVSKALLAEGKMRVWRLNKTDGPGKKVDLLKRDPADIDAVTLAIKTSVRSTPTTSINAKRAAKLDFLCIGVKDIIPPSVASKTWAGKVIDPTSRRLLVDRGTWKFRPVGDPRDSLPSPAFHAAVNSELKSTTARPPARRMYDGDGDDAVMSNEPFPISDGMTVAHLTEFFALSPDRMSEFTIRQLSAALRSAAAHSELLKGLRPSIKTSIPSKQGFLDEVARVGNRWLRNSYVGTGSGSAR